MTKQQAKPKKIKGFKLTVMPCPGHWTIFPWIQSCQCPEKCGGWQFSWVFLEITRIVLVIDDD